mmetsp:Transcript_23790/g.35371  ORF Transcript_23790/g.35371 Transcript_23790/m.35371 type:complete len:522 (+) Transcript_23790:295-1860(+)
MVVNDIEEIRSPKVLFQDKLDDGRNSYRFISNRKRKNYGNDLQFQSSVVTYQFTANFLFWILKSQFSIFALFSCLMFVFITLVFAFLVIVAAHFEPACVTSSIFETANSFVARLNDAWQLSWTTFSTVGYGMISPSTSAKFTDEMDYLRRDGTCALISFVLSVECLVGILFVSFCSAILYSKLMQFQSNAQVEFSDIIVVKFGHGVQPQDIDDDLSITSNHTDSEGLDKTYAEDKLPCPVLVFRIVNLQHSMHDGEIVNADVNVAATVDYKNAMNSFFQGAEFRNAFEDHRVSLQEANLKLNPLHSLSKMHNVSHLRNLANFHVSKKQKNSVQVDEEFVVKEINSHELDGLSKSIMIHTEEIPTGSMEGPNLVFAKILMDPVHHPFFKTTWRVVHTLNAESPLLTKSARKRVMECGGYWPADMNNVVAVEQSIDFDQFLISFSGLSKATGCDVYKHHTYKKRDVKVGYQFKSILTANRDGSIGVEENDINEIKVQDGGFDYRNLQRSLQKQKSGKFKDTKN